MYNFQDLDIKVEYRSFVDNIVKDFFIPTLKCSKQYDRAVGFFSSSALIEISKGISGLVKNGGKMRLIASPKLSDTDIEAIEMGYKKRDKVITESLLNELKYDYNDIEKARMNILASLIANNNLEIKIAFTETDNSIGMYHEKLGIIRDLDDNLIVFTGSMNESSNAFKNNYETIDIFKSWTNDLNRVTAKKEAFERLWNNEEKNLKVCSFPELNREIIKRYKEGTMDLDVDEIEYCQQNKDEFDKKEVDINLPKIPKSIEFYNYQIEAIESWKKADFRGIFDMATGTGKTFTGLGALVKLYEYIAEEEDGKLACIIVCPFQHLVEQWVEDLKEFNIDPIIGYSASPQSDWKRMLKKSYMYQSMGVDSKKFVCFICTNATFTSEFVQEQIRKINCKKLLLVDEAHNFGAKYLSKLMTDDYDYRLALSATIERYGDEDGTGKLFDFFGEKCIEYTLERAINEGKLTEYKYYPIIVTLTNGEVEEYKELSLEISKCLRRNKRGKYELSERGKILVLKRARIIAGAENKIIALKEEISKYTNEKNMLVYCGATNTLKPDSDETSIESQDLRQIDVVTDLLGNKLNMKVAQFTSKEDIIQRKQLKDSFAEGDIQALIAIKCLDEGVNIPQIDKAFILASTTNPKEYIQRRGRVLRLSKGKEYAIIYDFITLLSDIDEINSLNDQEYNIAKKLAKNELKRADEFADLSKNFIEVDPILEKIKNEFNLLNFEFEEEYNE